MSRSRDWRPCGEDKRSVGMPGEKPRWRLGDRLKVAGNIQNTTIKL